LDNIFPQKAQSLKSAGANKKRNTAKNRGAFIA